MISTWRGTQAVTTPVIDDILSAAVFAGQAITAAEIMVWSSAAFVPIVVAVPAIAPEVRIVATIRRPSFQEQFVTAAIIAGEIISLAESQTARGDRHRQDGRSDCFDLHVGLHFVESLPVCLVLWTRPVLASTKIGPGSKRTQYASARMDRFFRIFLLINNQALLNQCFSPKRSYSEMT